MARSLTDADYSRLLRFRTELRRFLRWSEQQAAAAGLTPAQHQLLVAVRGHDDVRGPTVGDIAAALLLRHHSVVELLDRAEVAGLVVRRNDEEDQRVVRISLTAAGERCVERLAALHIEELSRLGASLGALTTGLELSGRDDATR
jgi:DNA-binding MarR family transcriptional regulator